MSQQEFRSALARASAPFLSVALLLGGCATGQESLVGGSGLAAQDQAAAPTLDETAPGMLAVSGNAVLPGARSPAAAAVLGVGGATGPVGLNAGAPLATAALSTAGLAGSLNASTSLARGPLLALNTARGPLPSLGATPATNLLGAARTTTTTLSVTPASATTGLLAFLGAMGAAPSSGAGGTGGTGTGPGGTTAQPPVVAPVAGSRVPGVAPLNSLVSRLPGGGGLVGH